MGFGLPPLPTIGNHVPRHLGVIGGVHLGLAAKVEFKTTVLYLARKKLLSFLGAGIPLVYMSLVWLHVKGEPTKAGENSKPGAATAARRLTAK